MSSDDFSLPQLNEGDLPYDEGGAASVRDAPTSPNGARRAARSG